MAIQRYASGTPRARQSAEHEELRREPEVRERVDRKTVDV